MHFVRAIVWLCEIHTALARFIIVGSPLLWDSVPAFRVKLGANDLICVDEPFKPYLLTRLERGGGKFYPCLPFRLFSGYYWG